MRGFRDIWFTIVETIDEGADGLLRVIVLGIGWFLLVMIPWIALIIAIDSPYWGFIAGLLTLAFNYDAFLLSVPEWTGLVTVNLIGGGMENWSTGLWVRYPWQQVKLRNYINLQLVTPLVEITETYPAKDGPVMHTKWGFQYRPKLDYLDQFIGVSKTDIDKDITSLGGSFLEGEIWKRDKGEDSKNEHHAIEHDMKKLFEDESFQRKYGIEMVAVTLYDLDFDKASQKARETQFVGGVIDEMAAATVKKHPEVSQKDALNQALLLNGNVTKQVYEIEGLPNAINIIAQALIKKLAA